MSEAEIVLYVCAGILSLIFLLVSVSFILLSMGKEIWIELDGLIPPLMVLAVICGLIGFLTKIEMDLTQTQLEEQTSDNGGVDE